MPVQTLSNAKINDLFTVVVEIDLQLKITSVSPLLDEYAPDVSVGSELTTAFELIRPSRVNKETIESKVDMMYLMISKQSRYPVRGQLVKNDSDDGYLLLGSPWLSRLESDNLHSYELNNFPAHDAQLDWLFMLASEQQRVRDLEKLSNKLKAAKADAEKANAAKSSFFAVMSHEMRTPLNAVIGAMNLMKDEDLDPKHNELLDMGISASQHLLKVINDVLDLSKIEAGKMTLENNLIDTYEMLEDIKAICQSRAIGKSLGFNVKIRKDVPRYIRSDDGKIKQILINLIGNAIKFTEKGKIEVHVEMIELKKESELMRISIVDTGKGISEENKDLLFNEFWTSQSGSELFSEGTGLGLDISRRLVHLLDGTIDFSSVEGEGSTFWIDIPVKIEEQKKSALESTGVKLLVDENAFLGKRVLLAEDNQANQLVGRLYLERMGFTVDIANNGVEAIELMRDHTFDLVLMDLGMPVMDGVEATKYIRHELHLTDLPVVACTAHSLSDNISKLLQDDFTDYIPKPINRHDLQRVIASLVPISTDDHSEAKSFSKLAEVIDKQELDRLMEEVGKENAPLMLNVFVKELDKRIASIEIARSEKDITGILEAAHGLKSSAYSYGAIKLGDLLTYIETTAKAKDAGVFEKIEELLSLSAETRKSIIKMIDEFH